MEESINNSESSLEILDLINILRKRIENGIKKKNARLYIDTLLAAEKYLNKEKELLYEAFIIAGDFYKNNFRYVDSIVNYNKARKYASPSTIITVFDKIIETFDKFYINNLDKFIKNDLIKISTIISELCNYYEDFDNSKNTIERSYRLLNRIDYRIKYEADDKIEGNLTHAVDYLLNSIEKDIPLSQVNSELAKFLSKHLKKWRKDKKNNKDTQKN